MPATLCRGRGDDWRCCAGCADAVEEWQEAEWGALPRYEGDGLVLAKHVFQYRRSLDAGGTGTPEEREVRTAEPLPHQPSRNAAADHVM